MIIGIGSDLIDIRRVEKSLERFGDRFTDRIFTEIEKQKAGHGRNAIAAYAKRFAAKEACAKALGSGIAMGVFWKEMGVVNRQDGGPVMELTGGAAARLAALTPPGHEAVVHLTMTDEPPYAQAFVVIEARPTSG
ncbi:holo-ACP synthase [Rhizobium sp. PAMB 3174]